MLAMGCIKSLIIDKVSNGKVSIDMASFLTQVVLTDLQESGKYSIYLRSETVKREFMRFG